MRLVEIEITTQERQVYFELLVGNVQELLRLDQDHKKKRGEMKAEREQLQAEVERLTSILSTGKEVRAIEVEPPLPFPREDIS